MTKHRAFLLAAALAVGALSAPAAHAQLPASNPFAAPSTLPFQAPPRYHSTYFSHIWGGSYAAGYYACLWAEVIDDDAYFWFKENGGMTRAKSQRFRDMVLSRGGSQDLAAMCRAFRGRDPEVQPLLEERGLAPAKP